jgi:hypothetical protein
VGELLPHHQALTPEQVAEIAEVVRLETELVGLLAHLAHHYSNGGREFAVAKTNVQQARMWAVQGITAV